MTSQSRQNISSGAPWESIVGYSRAVSRLIDPQMLVEIEVEALLE